MARAPRYNLIEDYGTDIQSITTAPGWVIAVVRLGFPLSYSRETRKSVSTDVSEGGRLRDNTIIITSDCLMLSVSGSKDSHLKTLTAELKETDHNYLVEILPGDWVLAWMLNYSDGIPDLIQKIKDEDACNTLDDGFKFVGRVESIRKRINLDRDSGRLTSSVTLGAVGFKELDSQFFYDPLIRADDGGHDLGTWLNLIGVDTSDIFDLETSGAQKNNSGRLLETMLRLIIGTGVDSAKLNAIAKEPGTENLQAGAGAGQVQGGEQAPYAYIIPRTVGKLLGVDTDAAQKPGSVLGFADILDVFIGVQSYENKNATQLGKRFEPSLDDLLGTFLPIMPEFTDTPLWSILQQFLNQHINEIYTAYRVNADGLVMPTLVARQIPSTEAFAQKDGEKEILITKHLDVPRWVMHKTMINNIDIGRADASRFNFIHVYGKDAGETGTGPQLTEQLAINPPARDDLDIQRSGLRPYIATVACALEDTVGSTPGTWIALIADRLIGHQYTLNGTVSSIGIQSPISEGDNLQLLGDVYQIESVNHTCLIGSDGVRSFVTNLSLTNGMSRQPNSSDTDPDFPQYSGFKERDNTELDPGISLDDSYDRTSPQADERDKTSTLNFDIKKDNE